jgi:putative membrane protein
MNLLTHWIASALVIGIAAYIVPGVEVGITSALIATLVIGLVNFFIRPILLLVTLPLNILTLGLLTFVINGLLVLLASAIVPGFQVDGLLIAILFSLVLTLVHIIVFKIFRPDSHN